MIDESHCSQLLACEKMLLWTEKHNCLIAQQCLKASIKYHEKMLEGQLIRAGYLKIDIRNHTT